MTAQNIGSDIAPPPAPRKAHFHATYSGDVEDIVGKIMGRTTYGEFATAIDASFDPATGKTRVGFDRTNSADVEAFMARRPDLAQHEEFARLFARQNVIVR